MDGYREYRENYPDEELVKEALALYEDDMSYEDTVRADMAADLRFGNGQHWPDNIRNQRENVEYRPCLVVPRLNQFLNKVKNELRQNKISIKVSAGDGPEPERIRVKQADRRQSRIRKIQYDSCAMDAFQTAYDFSVDCGRGAVRLRTDYANSESFKQKIIIDRITNPLRCVWDKNRKMKDYSDCKHAFYLDDIKKDLFREKYPNASETHFIDDNNTHQWNRGDSITVAEFYCMWAKKRTLWLLSNGVTIYEDQLDPEIKKELQPVKKRVVREPYIMWYKITACEVLEKAYIPGKYIPLVPIVGVEKDVDGQLQIKGMIRDAKDSAKMYDYVSSNEAEQLQLAIKTEYIVADGQIKGYENYWKNANVKNYAYLPYKPISVGGTLVPPPQKQFPKQPDMALLQSKAGIIEDMKAITGIYDPSLGNQSNEVSGRAIMARQRQSDTANAHFPDGLRIAVTQVGKIINDWIPIYDSGTVQGMTDEDEETQIKLGDYEDGAEVSYGEGDFNLVVTMGPDFNTRRQESLEMMMELIGKVPGVAQFIWDLLVKNIDAPGAQQIADRLKKLIPPQILEQEGGEQQMAMRLQQAMQQIQKDKTLIQALQQQLQQVMRELETKGIENATKMKVAQINAMTDIEVANIKAQSDKQKEDNRFRQELFKAVSQKAEVNNGSV